MRRSNARVAPKNPRSLFPLFYLVPPTSSVRTTRKPYVGSFNYEIRVRVPHITLSVLRRAGTSEGFVSARMGRTKWNLLVVSFLAWGGSVLARDFRDGCYLLEGLDSNSTGFDLVEGKRSWL